MKLIIVESPSKAKTIQKYLGAGYRVLASGGHICDLPERTLGIDVEHDFMPEYVISKDKVDLLKRLKTAVKDSDEVYLATDPDREGEAISWHLSTNLSLNDAQRIEFNEISPKAINKALGAPRKINMSLVDAQQARRVLDRLVGYKISPILSKKIKPNLSGGRVQSAALKMIVDREKEIRDFVPEEYWSVWAFLSKKSKSSSFKSALADLNGEKLKITSGEQAKNVLDALNAAEGWVVDKLKRGVAKSKPSPPFTTSTMQQDGSSRLGLTSPEIMKIAQQLYEGIEIEGEGHVALVTYIRTDSVRVSAEAQQEALTFIQSQFGKEYAPTKPNFYTTKSQGVQDAHEAIRPISLEMSPESLKNKLNRNQYRLYKLIYERFLASQMTDAVYNTLNIHINALCGKDKYGFKLVGRTVVFKGYTIIYDVPEKEDDDEDDNAKLPDLKEGEELNLKEIKTEQKFTKPPSRYTDATLVKAMEENGIGRPSTYASVISILSKREYTQKEQKAIKPTSLGETVTAFMEKNFNEIVDTRFTANIEAKLDTIEHGEKWNNVIAEFYPPFIKNVYKAYSMEKKMKVEEEVTDVKCEKCGSFMVVRSSRYGKFLACPRYPECKFIKNIVEPVGKCPYCGGDVVKKKTKAGKVFYGCGNYPKCDFMSWEIPAPILCPKCNGIMKKSVKGDTETYTCLNKSCEHTELRAKDSKNDATD